MSDKKKAPPVVEVPTKKRYISDAIRQVFTASRKGKVVNVVDGMFAIADALNGLKDTVNEARELLAEMYTTPDEMKTSVEFVNESPLDTQV